MTDQDLKLQLKQLIVKAAQLKDREAASISDDGALFGSGLGLDSLDALQIAMEVEEQLGVRLPEGEESRSIFASVESLATYIAAHRGA